MAENRPDLFHSRVATCPPTTMFNFKSFSWDVILVYWILYPLTFQIPLQEESFEVKRFILLDQRHLLSFFFPKQR